MKTHVGHILAKLGARDRVQIVVIAYETGIVTGNLDSKTGGEVLALLRRSSQELGQTIIMVWHDPVAASYADRVVLMSDGGLVGEIRNPTTESVLSALGKLGG